MSYIGTPPSNAFTSLLKQDFSTSATTGYTLDHAVNNANDIALFINFVRQEPTAGYAASGTSLVLTSATASSDDMYCVYLGQALQTVNPPNVSVGTAQLIDGAVTSAKLASGAVANTPSFMVSLNASQTLSHNTSTKITLDREIVDTDSAFASNKFTVPSGKAGKYYIQFSTLAYDGTGVLKFSRPMIYKNGSMVAERIQDPTQNFYNISDTLSIILDLSVSDYIEFYYKGQTGDSGNFIIQGDSSDFYTYGFGYKLIGV